MFHAACTQQHTLKNHTCTHNTKGGRDTLAVPADIDALKAALAPGTLVRHAHHAEYAHLDYELGSDVQPSYDEMIELAVQYAGDGAAAGGGNGAGGAAGAV